MDTWDEEERIDELTRNSTAFAGWARLSAFTARLIRFSISCSSRYFWTWSCCGEWLDIFGCRRRGWGNDCFCLDFPGGRVALSLCTSPLHPFIPSSFLPFIHSFIFSENSFFEEKSSILERKFPPSRGVVKHLKFVWDGF